MLPAVVGSSKAGMAVGFAGALKPAGGSAARLPAQATMRASAAKRAHDLAMRDVNDIVAYLQTPVPRQIYSTDPAIVPSPATVDAWRRQGLRQRSSKIGANLRESAFLEQSSGGKGCALCAPAAADVPCYNRRYAAMYPLRQSDLENINERFLGACVYAGDRC